MRDWRRALAMLAVVALTAGSATGCSRLIDGVAQPDPYQPRVALAEDGYGIVAGDADAAVQLELYTEPQCSHCADLQSEFGDEIKAYLQSGQLAVTYRPLTFLDDEFGNAYSGVVTNALFLAVDPSTFAGAYQKFVEQLWANQDLAQTDYTDADVADIARASGLSDGVVETINAGESAVDPFEVGDANAGLLYELIGAVQTPVVYDLNADVVVDTSDEHWLDDLMKSV